MTDKNKDPEATDTDNPVQAKRLTSSSKTAAKAQQAIDAKLKFISQTHRREFRQRCRYEWRTLTATLTFFVLAAATSLKQGMLKPQNCQQEGFVWLVSIAVTVSSIFYLKNIHAAHRKNKEIAQAAEDNLIDSTSDEVLKEKRENAKNEHSANWSLYWQSAIIFVFAIASTLIIISSRYAP